MPANSLGYWLKARFGDNMAEMSRATGVHRNQLKGYVDGTIAPQLDVLERIAKGTGVSVALLVASPEERQRLEAKPAANMLDGVSAAIMAKLEAIEAKQAQTVVAPQSHHLATQSDVVDRIALQLRSLPAPLLNSLERIFSNLIASQLDEYRKRSGSGQ